MARTIPSAFGTAAAASYGRLHILVKVTDQPTSLYLTTAADGLSYDSLTWDGDLHEFKFAVGPELDWRGGLASDGSAAISVIQGHASVAGTSTNNTFEKLKDLYDYVTPVTGLYEAALLNESSGDVRISLVWDDGTPTAAESIEVFRGYSENLSQANSGPLTIRLDPERQRWLQKTFLRKFGYETNYGNYDYGRSNPRPLYEPTKGRAVPLVYGQLEYAKGFVVHDGATDDDTVQSGLILCFSDNKFNNYKGSGSLADDAKLYTVWGTEQFMLQMQRVTPDTSVEQYEWVEVTVTPEYLGGSAGNTGRGSFVRFRDGDVTGDGYLIFSELRDLVSGSGAAYDGDSTTYEDSIDIDPTGTTVPGFVWRLENVDLPGTITQFFGLLKYTCTSKNVQIQFNTPGGGLDYFDTASPSVGTFASDLYDNWRDMTYEVSGTPTGTLDKKSMGYNDDAGWNNPQALGTHSFEVECITTPYPALSELRFFGAAQYVWTTYPWRNVIDSFYGRVWGIDDSSYMTYSTDYLHNPAEIFEHFVTEVLELSSRVDTTAAAVAAANMDTDGVRMDFQLLDGDMTAEEFLDKLALQSMSYIVPTGSGQEKIIYRPTYHASSLDYSYDPITSSDILKGSFRSEYTSRDDVRAGAIVNYAWNEALGKFADRKIMVPTAHRLASNFTNATLQGWVDAIEGDFEAIEVDADLIQDETTAELLCKWLVQLHGRRRQILEFELPLEFAWIEAGDVIGVDHPMVRVYASGDSYELSMPAFPSNWPLEFKCSTATTTNPPVPASADIVPIAHRGDVLFIEEGTLEGEHFHLYPANSGADIYCSGGSVTAPVVTTAGAWRICPSFDVLSAKVVHSRTEGPRIYVRCIERPVLRAMSDSITD